ncbi:PucR family transcriptional regulator [bacterium]|nr:MAG: PucR family transcriptional regulator [bacterium]
MGLRVADLFERGVMGDVQLLTRASLDRQVRWVHTWPEVEPWLHGGELLLTTAYSWPAEVDQQRRIVRELDGAGVAALLFGAAEPFFPRTPAAIVEEADRLGLAIFESGEDRSFAELVECINREIIRTQFETIERSERIHRTLTAAALEAHAVGDIAERLAQLIDKRIAILDRRRGLLTDTAPDWSVVGEAVEAAIDALPMQETHPIRHFTLPGADVAMHGAVFPVRAGRDLAGYLAIWCAGGEITELDVRAGEHGVVVVGLHLLRQQALADAETRVRNSFVEAVLQGRLADDSGLRERAQMLGFDPAGTYHVVLVSPVLPDGGAHAGPLSSAEDVRLRARLGHALQASLQDSRLPSFIAYALNQVIALVPAASTPAQMRERVERLWRLTCELEPQPPFAFVVSRASRGDADVAGSLRDAQTTLRSARGSGVWWYEDFLVMRVLRSAADHEALDALISSTLKPLRSQSDALYETARTLVAVGFSQRQAARELGVHWNTLRHRVVRIEELLGAPLSNPELRLRLHLALEAERVSQL